ncbi:MAG: hypothetical protein KA313_11595, partial [Pseudarcicella sp.]|nr:hypothetical protein [Pseudarcicella sp.]
VSKINAEIVPDIVYFYSNFKMLEINQFVFSDLTGVPIFRNDMLDLIVGNEPINFISVPAIMIDDKCKNEAFDVNGTFISAVPHKTNYTIYGMYETISAFDYEESVYSPNPYLPGSIYKIKKIVLKSQERYFPRIFKIKEAISSNFIREDVKDLLEKNGIKGCVFEEVEVSG